MKTIELIIKRLSEFGAGLFNILTIPMEIIESKLKQDSAYRYRETEEG